MPISPSAAAPPDAAFSVPRELPLRSAGAPLPSWRSENARHGLEHLVVVEGLGDVVHRAHLHRVDRRAQARVAGHDQDRGALGELDQLGTRGAGQAQVADDQVEAGDAVALLGFLDGAGFADLVLVAFKQAAQGRTDNGFVFDDENMWH